MTNDLGAPATRVRHTGTGLLGWLMGPAGGPGWVAYLWDNGTRSELYGALTAGTVEVVS